MKEIEFIYIQMQNRSEILARNIVIDQRKAQVFRYVLTI